MRRWVHPTPYVPRTSDDGYDLFTSPLAPPRRADLPHAGGRVAAAPAAAPGPAQRTERHGPSAGRGAFAGGDEPPPEPPPPGAAGQLPPPGQAQLLPPRLRAGPRTA